MNHKATYLDSGFYLLSDAAAGALVRVLGQKLPAHGMQKYVMLEITLGGQRVRLNAWLQRTDLRHSMRRQSKRGWAWALFGFRRDAGVYLPPLGEAFTFEAVASTQAVAA